ncbi:MAG TPA: outer membrane beta-barrel protein, partial [Gammaproteobacteria bacterium]|nr:outer membrane beta-barrel protein [Gammaproteobacteria bacterium]
NGPGLSSSVVPAVFTGSPNVIDPGAIPPAFAGAIPYSVAQFSPVIKTSLDDEDFGWKLYGGYHLNPYLGVEIGYSDLGAVSTYSDYSYSNNIPSRPPLNVPGTITIDRITNATEKVTGFFFAGSGRYPLTEKVTLSGKLGAYAWTSLLEVNLSIHGELTYATMPVLPTNSPVDLQFSSSLEDDGISLLFGLGAEYTLNERITVRGEWERFNDIRIGGNWVDMFSLGLSYHFDVM